MEESYDNESDLLIASGSESESDALFNISMNFTSKFDLDVSIQIGLYSLIFCLAVIGNFLVILTLVQNQGMRTITNLFLLNLAISDLLVGVLCMPFTLVGIMLKDFIFGSPLCKLIPYLQVSVSAWTLVAISVERYYAICHPLTSRRWQTLSHAYRIITLVWILSGISMLPIAIVNKLQPIRDTGRHKCREEWPDVKIERAYTVFLDVTLLILPLGIMSVKYSLITVTLWQVTGSSSTQNEISLAASVSANYDSSSPSASPKYENPPISLKSLHQKFNASFRSNHSNRSGGNEALPTQSTQFLSPPPVANLPPSNILRRSNLKKSIDRKKRVIQMLAVVVTEFFLCWTPLYVMNTWYLFNPWEVYDVIGPLGVSLIHLISYISSCVNPITYCFMNKGFRVAFFHVLGSRCGFRKRNYASVMRYGHNESFRLAYNPSASFN